MKTKNGENMKNGRGRPKGQSSGVGMLGKLIANFRSTNKVGLKEVADKLGVSVQFISNIEHGRAPLPVAYIKKLSRLMGVDVGTLATAVLASRNPEISKLVSLTE